MSLKLIDKSHIPFTLSTFKEMLRLLMLNNNFKVFEVDYFLDAHSGGVLCSKKMSHAYE
jgi:hypothetical protein